MARTASISTIRDREARFRRSGGFTLIELLVASMLSALVFAAIFSAYLFVARNFTRITNTQQQLKQQRTALYWLGRDVNEATGFSVSGSNSTANAMDSQMILALQGRDVKYVYTSASGTLKRYDPSTTTTPTTLISNLTAFTFIYYARGATTAQAFSSHLVSNANMVVGQVEVRFTTSAGTSSNGTQSTYSVVSSRLVFRGKPAAGQ